MIPYQCTCSGPMWSTGSMLMTIAAIIMWSGMRASMMPRVGQRMHIEDAVSRPGAQAVNAVTPVGQPCCKRVCAEIALSDQIRMAVDGESIDPRDQQLVEPAFADPYRRIRVD